MRIGYGEIAFCAAQADLDVEYRANIIVFTWEGFDEMDGARGAGSAGLRDEGTVEMEFAYHLGDGAILKAVRK